MISPVDFFFPIGHCLSMVGLRPSSSLSTGCVVSLRGDWAIFCHAGSGRVGKVRSAIEKSLEILRRGWELNPGHGEDRQWAIPLSYHDWLCVFNICKFWLFCVHWFIECVFKPKACLRVVQGANYVRSSHEHHEHHVCDDGLTTHNLQPLGYFPISSILKYLPSLQRTRYFISGSTYPKKTLSHF